MEQRLCLYTHPEQKLFYISVHNNNSRLTHVTSLANVYGNAKTLFNQMEKGESPQGLRSGFMISVINTDYSGWEFKLLDEVYADGQEAADAKVEKIYEFQDNNPDWNFVGVKSLYIKGKRNLDGISSKTWKTKWNLSRMTISNVRDKIDMIVQSIKEEIPQTLYKDAYMCIIVPGYMQKRHNFEAFEIDDLISLFRYVRKYMGYDNG